MSEATGSVPATRFGTLAGTGFMVLSAAGYGAMPTLVKLSYASGANVGTLLVVRFLAGALILWCWLIATRRIRRLPLRAWISMLGLGVWMVVNAGSYFLALSLLPVTTVALIGSITPAVVAAAAALLLRERFTPAKLMALALAMGGGVLLVGFQSMNMSETNLLGIAMTLLNILAYSIYVILTSRLAVNVPPAMGAALISTGAGICYSLITVAGGGFLAPTQPDAWIYMLSTGVFSTALGMLAYLAGVSILGASRATIIGNVEPLISVGLAAIVLGEPIFLQHIAGGTLIMAALILLNLHGLIAISKRSIS